MAKFATPVAMKVTKEQGTYLLNKLITMGYEETSRDDEGYIATNWNSIHHAVAIASHKPAYKKHIIEEYNPELFLAIAAMTDRENPNGSGNYTKATLEELTNHFSKPKETFVLPKKWKLKVTEENVGAVNKWKASLGNRAILAPYDVVNQSGFWTRNSMASAYEMITTEQFMEHVYKPAFNKEIPEEFYVKYCEGFTEDIFNELRIWAAKNGDVGGESKIWVGYAEFIRQDMPRYFLFERDCPNGDWSFGINNMLWDNVETEYTLEQVKELINYKPKTNKNEYKEDSYERESREIKQIDEDLDSISSRERGKEIKIRTVSSRNLCERGSIESPNSITSPRGSSRRIRAERGRLYI